MVMDANQQQQPSPQSVGREFVRQYYTLLNKAPQQLHRFYNHNSSFIHDESTLYIGQKNIHNRIQQLNFNDCHAKISQVDSQATLGNGVVVQVTGELSNDGQPMRRFTQTFVLAAQSPKKYYVHNDIFRYQDVYSDEENDGELRPEVDEEHEHRGTPVSAGMGAAITNDHQTQVPLAGEIPQPPSHLAAAQVVATPNSAVLTPQQQPPAGPPQQFYISLPTAGGTTVSVITAAAPPQGAVPLPAQYATNPTSGVTTQVQPTGTVPQLNGVITHDEIPAGIIYQNNQANASVAAPPQIVPQNASPIVAAAGGVAVAGAPVIAGPHALATVAVPVAAATTSGVAPPTAAAATMPASFKAPPLVQQQIIQQIPQPIQQTQPQPQIGSASPQTQQPDFVSNNQVLAPSPIPPTPVDVVEETVSRSSNAVTPTINETPVQATPIIEPLVRQSPVVEDFKTITEQQQQEKLEQAKAQHHQQQQSQLSNQNQQTAPQQQSQQASQAAEPKTYANLFKSSTSTGSFVNAALQQQQQLQQQQLQQQQQQPSNPMYNSNSTSGTYAANNTNSYTNRNNNESSSNIVSSGQNSLPQRNSQSRLNKDFDQRRSSNSFGDSQQLFLGNIPHHASEDDLKALFSRFGTVLELRILSKQSGKAPPGVRNPLNYGFITYEDPESVQYCLANCPLYFPEDSPDRQKLNVEEKKPRMRNELPPRQGGGNNMNNNMNSQRNSGSGGGAGHSSRSISNSSGNVGGGMMRGGINNNSNSMSRGNSGGGGGPRSMGGGFHRNENRNSSQMRGGNNAQSGGSGGNYARR